MSRRRLSAAALCLALLCAPARPRPAQTPKPSELFLPARAVEAGAAPGAEAFEFELHGFAYHVRRNGNGRRTKGAKVRGFNLRLDVDAAVTALFYSEFEGDLLLLLHVAGQRDGEGLVTRLEQPSMRAVWQQQIAATDVGEPLREGRHLYLTGAGFVGKLDLTTGEYLWRQEGLEDLRGAEPTPLGAFDRPEIRGDAVLFRERPVYNPRRTLVFDKKTGKFIRVE